MVVLIVFVVIIWVTSQPHTPSKDYGEWADACAQEGSFPDIPEGDTGNECLIGKSSLTAEHINEITAGTPLEGTGEFWVRYTQEVNVDLPDHNKPIDPIWLLAMAKHEGWFRYDSGVALDTHNPGNIRCIAGYDCNLARFSIFPDMETGIFHMAHLIRGPGYVGEGRISARTVIYKWAPPGDSNDSKAYVEAVQSQVNTWRTEYP